MQPLKYVASPPCGEARQSVTGGVYQLPPLFVPGNERGRHPRSHPCSCEPTSQPRRQSLQPPRALHLHFPLTPSTQRTVHTVHWLHKGKAMQGCAGVMEQTDVPHPWQQRVRQLWWRRR